ncbi:hypothetical protein [Mucilaginibacter gotjawali]|uniref:Uncharacterized protein n=2 Tax=Mucilaginibacter gotjawali TaxID=1550579 RepID=A0A839SFJ0_9SPHI|nr:hypothetical protein [Mucilaginibacter gotjawali]MBB3055307.1 hypothetical protein [Mucilaginibacter gotjawali]BAU53416.1 hypothetical protein MgSA37_01584 [Mucilaginibacter gotjawali]
MKKTFLTLFAFLAFIQLHAQNIELSLLGNTGLFRYTGNYTTSTSFINGGAANSKTGYTNNPYGNKFGFSYGGGVQVQHVGRSGFIFGLQGGYQILRSKVDLNGVYRSDLNQSGIDFTIPAPTPVTGQTYLQSQDINVNPYIGYRLKMKKVKLDLTPGFDVAFNLNTHEYGKATDMGGNFYKTDQDRGKFPADFRFSFRATVSCNKFSITAGFIQGLTNFSNHLFNDSPTAYYTHSQLISLGLAYRIR